MRTVSPLDPLADCGVDEVDEVAPVAPVREPDEVGKERGVDPLTALVRRDPCQLQDLVDVRLRQEIVAGAVADTLGEAACRVDQPLVHGEKPSGPSS
jgi:hypothetical protein